MRVSEWDDRYRSSQRGQKQEPAPLVTRFVSSLRPGRALDLACGAGRHAVYLANLAWDVTAVDGSAAALEILEERAKHSGVQVSPHISP